MSNIPSPCISVCKFKRAGHCIGCSMTKEQKSAFKKMKKDKHRLAFVQLLTSQQIHLGKYRAWAIAYDKKCHKKGVELPPNVADALSEVRG